MTLTRTEVLYQEEVCTRTWKNYIVELQTKPHRSSTHYHIWNKVHTQVLIKHAWRAISTVAALLTNTLNSGPVINRKSQLLYIERNTVCWIFKQRILYMLHEIDHVNIPYYMQVKEARDNYILAAIHISSQQRPLSSWQLLNHRYIVIHAILLMM